MHYIKLLYELVLVWWLEKKKKKNQTTFRCATEEEEKSRVSDLILGKICTRLLFTYW